MQLTCSRSGHRIAGGEGLRCVYRLSNAEETSILGGNGASKNSWTSFPYHPPSCCGRCRPFSLVEMCAGRRFPATYGLCRKVPVPYCFAEPPEISYTFSLLPHLTNNASTGLLPRATPGHSLQKHESQAELFCTHSIVFFCINPAFCTHHVPLLY